MKFYRMKNGDIVTDLHISTKRANALKGTRMYDAGNKTLCCSARVYYDGVKGRLDSAATAVLLNQIDERLKGVQAEEPELPHVTNWEKLSKWVEKIEITWPIGLGKS